MAFQKTIGEIIKKPRPDFNRLRKALLREGNPDELPFYELFADREIMEAVLGKKVTDRVSTIEFYYKAGYDHIPVWPLYNMEKGSLIDTTSHYPISDWQTFETYRWPRPEDVSYEEFEAVDKALPEGMKMVGHMGGVFETAQELLGYTGLCLLLHDEPDLVEAVFERLGSFYQAVYHTMGSYENVGALVISDDLGFKTQTLISPQHLREYVLPWHKRFAEITHEHGKACILHSCGQLAAVMDDIISDVKIDAKHSFEDTILPVTEAKKLYGDRIAILGGYDLHKLCTQTEEEIRNHTIDLIELCGHDDGYAFGTGNTVAKYVPVENYLIMLDQAWQMRGH